MTNLVLFGAEVDSIQDTLFQASRQREVVGGSRLLARFGEEVARRAEAMGATVLATAGGQFRLLFSNEQQATDFSRDLSDAYRFLLNGSITVGETQQLKPDLSDFQQRSRDLFDSIALAKRAKAPAISSAQTPTTAFGESSGRALAWDLEEDKDVPAGSLRRFRYASRVVTTMRSEGKPARDLRGDLRDPFLKKIFDQIPVEGDPCADAKESSQAVPGLAAPNLAREATGWAQNVDSIAALHPLRNVAYLVADGNGMGALFGECQTPDQYRALSDALRTGMQEAVAAPIAALVSSLEETDSRGLIDNGILPLLPLILAGDDCFVLLPAYYAMDFARCFCLAFERIMRRKLTESPLDELNLPGPTMSAVVVFAKGHYPYRMARAAGEGQLKEVKRLVKTVAYDVAQQSGGEPERYRRSAVSYVSIVGNSLTRQQPTGAGRFAGGLGAYWATDQDLGDKELGAALPLEMLFQSRSTLGGRRPVPRGRRAELRELYDVANLPADSAKANGPWLNGLKHLRARMEASGADWPRVEKAWRWLGDDAEKPGLPSRWRFVKRYGDGFYAHGMPDLMAVWDYVTQFGEPVFGDEEGNE